MSSCRDGGVRYRRLSTPLVDNVVRVGVEQFRGRLEPVPISISALFTSRFVVLVISKLEEALYYA